jgi:hypothetical protein
MKTTQMAIAWLSLLLAASASADEPPFEDELLDRFVGSWVMQGVIAGDDITHDVQADWVLGHQYLRFHDVSRETKATGEVEYEATVYIGWDKPSGRYVCLWLDVTGGGGLANDVFGYAEPADDKLAFVWGTGNETWHTTFIYDRETDAWRWTMDGEKDGDRTPFARVALRRK